VAAVRNAPWPFQAFGKSEQGIQRIRLQPALKNTAI
jgi:hypothetical protein